MLASELARELGINPSVMSRQLNQYYAATDFSGSRQPLEETVIEGMRKIHALMNEHPGLTMSKALDIYLGKATAPVPPAIAEDILQRISDLEASQKRMEEKFDEILSYFRTAYRAGDLPAVDGKTKAIMGASSSTTLETEAPKD